MKVIRTPDVEHAEKIQIALEKNGGYCPCMFVKTDDTRCKCKEFREQIKNKIPGACHCGLWIAVED